MRRPRRPRDEPPERPATSPRLTALRLLGRRDYTRRELTTALLTRGYEAEEVDETIDVLAAERILDDVRVAEAHVRTASRIKRRGPLRIKRELEARGVGSAAAHEATSALDAADVMKTIRDFIARKQGDKPLDLASRRRLFQQLIRRGFAVDQISKVLRYTPENEE